MDSTLQGNKPYCTWMADLPKHITTVPLNSLAIPGSHDSFAFSLDRRAGVAVDQTRAVKTLGGCCCGAGSAVIQRWSLTQRLDFYQQLENGVRYFDLRVAMKPGTIDFYFLHGLYGPKVIDSMKAIHRFLLKHDKEVIILDFNHFYNMNQISHGQLLNMLKDVFRELMVIPSDRWEPGRATLQDLWQTSRRVYIVYHNDAIHGVGGFWEGYKVPSPWPNTNKLSHLVHFQDDVYQNVRRRNDGNFYVWQCVTTPRTSDITFNLFRGSLADTLAAVVRPRMVNWLSDKVAGPCAINICLGDFVEADHFISTIININYKTYKS